MKKLKKIKKLTQAEKDARTSLWFTTPAIASTYLIKIHSLNFPVKSYLEFNMIILDRDLTKKEYKQLFPSKA